VRCPTRGFAVLCGLFFKRHGEVKRAKRKAFSEDEDEDFDLEELDEEEEEEV